jgi:hypothetical protein
MGVDSSVEPPGFVVALYYGAIGSGAVCCVVFDSAPLN